MNRIFMPGMQGTGRRLKPIFVSILCLIGSKAKAESTATGW